MSSAEEEEEFNPVTWADREHVWGPGSIDEHLAQIDGWGVLGTSLLDASGTPVMVLDYLGRPSEAARVRRGLRRGEVQGHDRA